MNLISICKLSDSLALIDQDEWNLISSRVSRIFTLKKKQQQQKLIFPRRSKQAAKQNIVSGSESEARLFIFHEIFNSVNYLAITTVLATGVKFLMFCLDYVIKNIFDLPCFSPHSVYWLRFRFSSINLKYIKEKSRLP